MNREPTLRACHENFGPPKPSPYISKYLDPLKLSVHIILLWTPSEICSPRIVRFLALFLVLR